MNVEQKNVKQADVRHVNVEQRNMKQADVKPVNTEQGNCSECRDWLPLYYAKSSTTSQNVQWMQHLLVCPDCRKEAGEMLAFARLVKEPLTLPKEVEVHAFDMIDFSEAGEAKTKKTLHQMFGISSLQESAGVVWKTLKVVPDKLSPLKEATQLAFRCCSVIGK